MSATEDLKDADGKPLDPAAQAVVDKVRRMSMISGIATVLGISVVVTLVGYRIYKSSESVPAQVEAVAMLPKGAKVIVDGGIRRPRGGDDRRRRRHRNPHLRCALAAARGAAPLRQ